MEAVRVGTAKSIREPHRVACLLTDRREQVDPGLGVERMTLLAPATEPLGWRPAPTALGQVPGADAAALVDTLANRLGAGRLYRLAAVESDIPERSMRRVAPLAAPTTGSREPGWPRPARLLSRPEPIETLALLPDHPPVHFTWLLRQSIFASARRRAWHPVSRVQSAWSPARFRSSPGRRDRPPSGPGRCGGWG